jgi:DHA1 family multidrug resistance protein-like MFS transporter
MFAVSLGLMAVLPTLPLYIEERFDIHDPAEVRWWAGAIFGAGPLAAALIGPLWGALGDRHGRRRMVVRSVVAIGVAMALMPLASSPLQMLLLRTLQGLFAGYVAPAMALVSAETPADRQGRTIAGLQVALASGLLFGPALGAEIAAWFGRAAVFSVTAGLCFVAAIPVALFTYEDRAKLQRRGDGERRGSLLREMFQPLQHRPFAILLLLILVSRLGLNMLEPFLALFVRELGALPWIAAGARDAEHAIDRTTAVAFTILAVAQFVFTPLWGRAADRFGPLRCLAVLALSLSGIYFATAHVETTEGYLALRLAAAAFMSGSMTLAYAAAVRRVPPQQRSVAFSLTQSCIQFGLAVGPTFGGAVASGASVRDLFPVAAALLFVAGVGMVILRVVTERPRNEPTPPADEGIVGS